ncbi:MAG: VOC family protein, partial [Gemmatimonadota bacterium]
MRTRGTDFVLYQVNDVPRAVAFYRDVLGLKLEGHWEEIDWAELAAPPTTLALWNPAKTMGSPARMGGGAIALAVEDVAAAVAELKGKGVPVVVETWDTPVCEMAVVADPDGNTVLLHHRKDD